MNVSKRTKRTQRWSFLGVTVLLCFSTTMARAENRALLIGIEHYEQMRPSLNAPANDVANIKQLALTSLGYKKEQITVLLDKDATRDNILSTIKAELMGKTQAGDRVLFYFSGHGYQVKDTNQDEADQLDETLVSYDTKVQQGKLVNMITDDDLQALFDQITDRKVMIIVDSCHSGTITRGLGERTRGARFIKHPLRIDSKTRSALTLADITDSEAFARHRQETPFLNAAKNRVVWSAVMAGQKARIDESLPKSSRQQSVFTRWFINGLQHKKADANKNGRVSYSELLTYTRAKSKQYCQSRPNCLKGLGLTPTLEAPKALLSAAIIPRSQFTDPPSIIDIANEVLPVVDEASIVLDVEVAEKPSHIMHLGDALFLRVMSKKAGYLLLLDQNANGELRQIYPTKYRQATAIKAGENIFIPQDSASFEVKATELGDSQLIALVMHDQVALASLMELTKNSTVIVNPSTYLTTLAQRLQATWTGDRINREVDYALRKFAYTVVK